MTTLGIGSRVDHPAYGKGVIVRLHKAAYEISFLQFGLKMVGLGYDKWSIIEAITANEEITLNEVEKSLRKVLRTMSDVSETFDLGDKWDGGTMILKPADPDLKSKEIPIDTFFHKIVMVRDRLRVMEQRINSSKLSDEEKVNLQQYITRIYGSLTTFNVLFSRKEDHFKGDSSK
jgi:hypothetical protein